MSKLSEELREAFRAANLRSTAQRYAVLEFLVRNAGNATAGEIFEAVNRGDPRASRATVYNSLRSLAHAGLVRELMAEGNAARFDANIHPHHHFVCDRCRRVDDIPWFAIPPRSLKAARNGREVRHYEVVFRGVCANCKP